MMAAIKFRPYAIILTAYTVPSPIFAAAFIGADKLKRIDFKTGSSPVTYVKQVLKQLPEGIPCFGKTTGFIINYEPDKAVQFDEFGNPILVLNSAYVMGSAQIRIF